MFISTNPFLQCILGAKTILFIAVHYEDTKLFSLINADLQRTPTSTILEPAENPSIHHDTIVCHNVLKYILLKINLFQSACSEFSCTQNPYPHYELN